MFFNVIICMSLRIDSKYVDMLVSAHTRARIFSCDLLLATGRASPPDVPPATGQAPCHLRHLAT